MRYEAVWGTRPRRREEPFERFVDWVVERRRRYPGRCTSTTTRPTSARRSAGSWASTPRASTRSTTSCATTCSSTSTASSSRRSAPRCASYSIKEIEKLYGFVRTAEVAGGDESVVLFEKWLESGDDSLLEGIEAYNEEDCRSTVAAPRVAPRAAAARDAVARAARAARAVGGGGGAGCGARGARARRCSRARPRRAIRAGSSRSSSTTTAARRSRSGGSGSIHLSLDEEELIEDTDTIGGLELVGEPEPDEELARLHVLVPAAGAQDRRASAVDPGDREAVPGAGRRRARARHAAAGEEPRRRAAAARAHPDPADPRTRSSARRSRGSRARTSTATGQHGRCRGARAAGRRVRALDLPVPEAALSLDGSYLFVQGPPGSGKTWQGAKTAVALMRAGRRVGVTSLSHKAIDKLLSEIEREAREQGFALQRAQEVDRGRRGLALRGRLRRLERRLAGPARRRSSSSSPARPGSSRARTSTGFCDTLFVDEAGQVSLADASRSARRAQPRLPRRPEPAPAGLAGRAAGGGEGVGAPAPARRATTTVPPDRGIFLERTWRLRPGALRVHVGRVLRGPPRVRRAVRAADAWRPATGSSSGRSSTQATGSCRGRRRMRSRLRSRALLGTSYTDESGRVRPLGADDVLVVTPYNAQVRALRRTVPEGVRVGTVDKFQGQEAPVVLVSLASSSGGGRAARHLASSSTGTGSTSRPRARSAASSSSARRGCSRPTARRSSRCARERALPLRRAGVRMTA